MCAPVSMCINHHPPSSPSFLHSEFLSSSSFSVMLIFLCLPHPLLCECCVSQRGSVLFSAQSPGVDKACVTGNSFAEPAVRERGAREGFYTTCMCTVQLCQESQPLSSCGFTLMRKWQSLTLIQGFIPYDIFPVCHCCNFSIG